MEVDQSGPFPVQSKMPEEDAYSVPAFTTEDEQRERQSLTNDERKKILADLCGLADDMADLRVIDQSSPSQRPTLRTPSELEHNMNLLNAELNAIPHDDKQAYLLAMLHCPDQLFGGWRGEVIVEMQQQDDGGGTRGQEFHAKQVAKNLVAYWERRLEAFGEESAFKPMTLAGAMEEELGAMASFCMHRISPCKDAAGRAVVVCTPRRRIRSLYPTYRQKRAFWYILECLSHDPETRQNGAVLIFDGNGLNPTLFDPKFIRWVVGAMNLFPIKWKALHFLNTNAAINNVMLPALKFLMKKHLRNRVLVHTGKTRFETLAAYKLPPECLPKDLDVGGSVEIDIVKWVSDRYALEGANIFDNGNGDMEDDSGQEPMAKRSRTTQSSMSPTSAEEQPSADEQQSGSAFDTLPANGVEMAGEEEEMVYDNAGTERKTDERMVDTLPANDIAMTAEEREMVYTNTGRKTDERMARALVLCLRDPDADRTEVLIAAGFSYNRDEELNDKMRLDSEGVSLKQRKNQLRRRLKQIKEQEESKLGRGFI